MQTARANNGIITSPLPALPTQPPPALLELLSSVGSFSTASILALNSATAALTSSIVVAASIAAFASVTHAVS